MMIVMKKPASLEKPHAVAAAIAIVMRATKAIRGAQIRVQDFSSAVGSAVVADSSGIDD
jgi:hypothetical protein